MTRRLEGLEPLPDIPRSEWPLHLKPTTIVNLEEVQKMITVHKETPEFLREALRYTTGEPFDGARTPRTIKSTSLTTAQIEAYVDYGKAEPVKIEIGDRLPEDCHGVAMWLHPELKRRFRVINEPALNCWIKKTELPKPRYPSRLERRQQLEHCELMLQVDFDAYYNSIPLEERARTKFVFRKGNQYYQLTTICTGGRWSVAVGQAITWTIADILTPCVILTMIDNVLVAAQAHQHKEFCDAVRLLAHRMQDANITTSPPTAELLEMSDAALVKLGRQPVTFLGETFTWDPVTKARQVANSTKTLAKLTLARSIANHTLRSFAALVSLVLFAMHTVDINPAESYHLMSAYRALAREAQESNWDAPLKFLSPRVSDELRRITDKLLANVPVRPRRTLHFSYDERDYDLIVFIDASAGGWGALVHDVVTGCTTAYQQQWINTLFGVPMTVCPALQTSTFCVKHSAHAEPTAVFELLRHLATTRNLPMRIAVVTDHGAIPHAQMKTNGFGGIGRGKSLNRLFAYVNTIPQHVHFFFISGSRNPADQLSRTFGADTTGGRIRTLENQDVGLPQLKTTYCPALREEERPRWMR